MSEDKNTYHHSHSSSSGSSGHSSSGRSSSSGSSGHSSSRHSSSGSSSSGSSRHSSSNSSSSGSSGHSSSGSSSHHHRRSTHNGYFYELNEQSSKPPITLESKPNPVRNSNFNSQNYSQPQYQQPEKKKKKLNGIQKVLVSIIAILLVLLIAVGGTGFYYLNKINYDDGTLTTAPVNPDGEDDEADVLNGELSADEQNSLSSANDSINANLGSNEIWYSEDVKNILLMGIDYGSSNYPYGRSDAMIIVSINQATGKLKLISLSRAVYAAIPGYNNTRLSHAHGYGGAALAIQAIQNNYKIRIDNYAEVNFSGFSSIIDALGGVTVDLSEAEAGVLAYLTGSSAAGTYTLNGKEALLFARTRKIDTDRNRTGRQRRILEALANKATSMSLAQMMTAMDTILPYVTTNLSRTDIIGMLAKAVTYLGYERSEDVFPHESSDLTLRDGFEVLLVDWASEVDYAHEVIYGDVQAQVATS